MKVLRAVSGIIFALLILFSLVGCAAEPESTSCRDYDTSDPDLRYLCREQPNCGSIGPTTVYTSAYLTTDGGCEEPDEAEQEQMYFCLGDDDGDFDAAMYGEQLDDGSWRFVAFNWYGSADGFRLMRASHCEQRVVDEDERALCEACASHPRQVQTEEDLDDD